MKKVLFTILSTFLAVSCRKDRTEAVKEMIAGREYKYWIEVKSGPMNQIENWSGEYGPYGNVVSVYYFDRNGKYLEMYIPVDVTNSKKIKDWKDYQKHSDMFESDKWSLKSFDVITLNDWDCKIIRLENNMMLLKGPDDVFSFYVPCPESLLPQNYRHIQ